MQSRSCIQALAPCRTPIRSLGVRSSRHCQFRRYANDSNADEDAAANGGMTMSRKDRASRVSKSLQDIERDRLGTQTKAQEERQPKQRIPTGRSGREQIAARNAPAARSDRIRKVSATNSQAATPANTSLPADVASSATSAPIEEPQDEYEAEAEVGMEAFGVEEPEIRDDLFSFWQVSWDPKKAESSEAFQQAKSTFEERYGDLTPDQLSEAKQDGFIRLISEKEYGTTENLHRALLAEMQQEMALLQGQEQSGSKEQSSAPEQDNDTNTAPASLQSKLTTLELYNREDPTPTPFEASAVTRAELLRSGAGGSTLAAGNVEGLLADRINALSDLRYRFRRPEDLARHMMRGGIVSFTSEQERLAVEEAARMYAYRLGKSAKRVRQGKEDLPAVSEFSRFPKDTRDGVVNRLLRGKYGFKKPEEPRSRVMEHVARSVERNKTYLPRDSAAFMGKVESIVGMQTGRKAEGTQQARK